MALQGAPDIYDISRLWVKLQTPVSHTEKAYINLDSFEFLD
jgi:hypothetical protein